MIELAGLCNQHVHKTRVLVSCAAQAWLGTEKAGPVMWWDPSPYDLWLMLWFLLPVCLQHVTLCPLLLPLLLDRQGFGAG